MCHRQLPRTSEKCQTTHFASSILVRLALYANGEDPGSGQGHLDARIDPSNHHHWKEIIICCMDAYGTGYWSMQDLSRMKTHDAVMVLTDPLDAPLTLPRLNFARAQRTLTRRSALAAAAVCLHTRPNPDASIPTVLYRLLRCE